MLEPRADYGFAASLDHAGPYKQVLGAEFGIAHTLSVAVEVFGFYADGFDQFRVPVGLRQFAKRRDQFFDFAVFQPIQLVPQPALLGDFIGRIQLASQIPKMLAGMIEVDDLNRAGEVLIRNIPNPVRAISHDYADGGAVPTPIPSFRIQT